MTSPEFTASFRRSLGSFVSGVTVVSCRAHGIDHAMTASAISSVSLEPPLILVGVSHTARFLEAIRDAEHWGVSILAATARSHAEWLSTKGRPLAGQLDLVPHHRGITGVALLDDSLAWLECRTTQRVTAGDHDIFIGEVVRAQLGTQDDPLVYWRSGYRLIAP